MDKIAILVSIVVVFLSTLSLKTCNKSDEKQVNILYFRDYSICAYPSGPPVNVFRQSKSFRVVKLGIKNDTLRRHLISLLYHMRDSAVIADNSTPVSQNFQIAVLFETTKKSDTLYVSRHHQGMMEYEHQQYNDSLFYGYIANVISLVDKSFGLDNEKYDCQLGLIVDTLSYLKKEGRMKLNQEPGKRFGWKDDFTKKQ